MPFNSRHRPQAPAQRVDNSSMSDGTLRAMFGSGYDKYFDSFKSSYEGNVTADVTRTQRAGYMARRGKAGPTSYTERTYSDEFLRAFGEHLEVSKAEDKEAADADARMRSEGGRVGLARDIMLRRQAARRRTAGASPSPGSAVTAILGGSGSVTMGGA